MKKLLATIMILVFAITCVMAQQTRKEKRAERRAQKIEEIKKLIDSEHFVFEAHHAIPRSGQQINLTSMYDVEFRNDSAFAYLPFFGIAYYADLDHEGGIKFKQPMEDKEWKDEGKKGYSMKFDVTDTKDTYQLYLDISPEGYAILKVSPGRKSPITFSGIITEKEEEEK
ncbi:DUF4251 domain-containing protein [Puteibacter caeruleilacunae]|nr:DUF4251 domain-containing protein [Puteibacter caeruleilacunae]